MFSKYKKQIIFSIVFGAIVFLGLSVYANFSELMVAFSNFNWLIFPLVLLFSLGNYIFRFFKWDYYTKILAIRIDRKMSMIIFFSSFIMSVTPGKIGEVFKSYLLREQNGTPISKSAPIVLAERITDFLSLILLSIIGAVTFGYGTTLMIVVGIFFILVILLISSKRISYRIIAFFEKIKFVSGVSHRIHTAYDSIYQLVRLKGLFIAILISVVAWGFECVGFYVIINGFWIENLFHIDIFVATFVYGFSTIAGSITMLPGGLGATDASITGLLVLLSIPKSIAVASTLLIRVATLWFAVIVGIAAILLYQRVTRKHLNEIVLTN
jgi:glycosyltransferase 2 family protein